MSAYRRFPAPDPDGMRELRALVRFRAADVTNVTGSLGTAAIPEPREAEDPTGGAGADVVALVAAAQQGDPEAFGALYDRYVDVVYRYIYYRVSNPSLTEDLVSETFLRALRRVTSFTWQGRDFGAWLVTIARNLIADHFKSGRYRLEVTTGDVLDADREDRGPEGSPEAAVVDHITNGEIGRAHV